MIALESASLKWPSVNAGIFLNGLANNAVLAALGAETERTALATWVTTDPTGRASAPGVWAVGNVADPAAFVIEAAAAGARAAAALNADLVDEDVARAMAERGRAAAGAAA